MLAFKFDSFSSILSSWFYRPPNQWPAVLTVTALFMRVGPPPPNKRKMTATFFSPKAQLGRSIAPGLQINGKAYAAHMQNQACLKDTKCLFEINHTKLNMPCIL